MVKEILESDNENNEIINKDNNKNEDIEEKKLYDQSIYDTLVNTKDALYSIVDDIIKSGIDYPQFTVFTRNNRLYYIGIGILIIVFILMIYNSLITNDKINNSQPIIVKLEK